MSDIQRQLWQLLKKLFIFSKASIIIKTIFCQHKNIMTAWKLSVNKYILILMRYKVTHKVFVDSLVADEHWVMRWWCVGCVRPRHWLTWVSCQQLLTPVHSLNTGSHLIWGASHRSQLRMRRAEHQHRASDHGVSIYDLLVQSSSMWLVRKR